MKKGVVRGNEERREQVRVRWVAVRLLRMEGQGSRLAPPLRGPKLWSRIVHSPSPTSPAHNCQVILRVRDDSLF